MFYDTDARKSWQASAHNLAGAQTRPGKQIGRVLCAAFDARAAHAHAHKVGGFELVALSRKRKSRASSAAPAAGNKEEKPGNVCCCEREKRGSVHDARERNLENFAASDKKYDTDQLLHECRERARRATGRRSFARECE